MSTSRGITLTEPQLPAPERDRHLRTDHLNGDLKRRAFRGGAVTLGGQAIKFVTQLGATAILARLLTPADFGLVAMVVVLTGFMFFFTDLGLTAVTVQRAEITQQQISSLFWINGAFGSTLAAIGTAFAPVVAWFFAEPRLIRVMMVLSTTFIFGGFTTQHYALLVRNMRFGAAALVQTGSSVFGFVLGIALAARGWGYWSLVAMTVGMSISAGVMSWIFSGWLPSWPSLPEGLGAMLRSGGATGSSILTYAVRNLDNIVVGRVSGPYALGLYAKAYGLVLLPVQQIAAPLNGVLLPVLSRLQNEPSRFRKYYLGSVGLLTLVSMPLVAFSFAECRALVLTFLGPKWIDATPLFQALALGAFAGTLTGAADWVPVSLGQSHRVLKWYCVSTPLTILSFIIGSHWGARGVAIGFSTVSCLLVFPNFWWALRASSIRPSDVIFAVWRPAVASIVVAVVLSLVIAYRRLNVPPVVELAIQAIIGSCAYILTLALFPGGRAFLFEAVSLLKRRSPD